MRSTQYAVLVALLCAGCRAASADALITSSTMDAGVAPAIVAAAAIAPPAPPSPCPSGMVLVEGDYCPDLEQKCLEWMDEGHYHFFRCKHYAHLGDAACKSKKKIHERFCIDATERTAPGSDLPLNHQSWTSSKKLCEGDGGRLCLTREWELACEGEEMRPYPYGWDRDSNICNADIDHGLGRIGRLVDHRAPASAHPACVSPFGVHDMVGNVDEWTTIEGLPRGSREVMHGSWWMPGRNACRNYQAGHNAWYEGTESGTRCCADPR